MTTPIIAPSLLAADFSDLRAELRAIADAGADWLHLDIMDGHFVPNISFGPDLIRRLRPHSALPFDAHLMIAPVEPYIAAFAAAGCDHIAIHPESGPHPHRALQMIAALGKKPGIVLNPGTPLEVIAPLIDQCDLIMMMSVNPGFGGQAFIAGTLPRIAAVRAMIAATGRDIRLMVDGGITAATAPAVLAAGADALVAGTAIFGASDYQAAISALRGRRCMTDFAGWLRNTRRAIARMQPLGARLGLGRVPDGPAQPTRDPWPGDPTRGAALMRGIFELAGGSLTLRPKGDTSGGFAAINGNPILLAGAHGFAWLRDLRALGTDGARMRARTLVGEWIASAATLPEIAQRPDVAGSRIAAWLGHYDFFAASADDGFRQRLMLQLVADARALSASLPTEELDARALTAIKGLVAAAVALPDHAAFMSRALRVLPQELGRQILADGTHCERSPAQQLAVLQDLTEIRALLQAGQITAPPSLATGIERTSLALRMLRHGDGRLALFNGTRDESAALIELALTQAGRPGRAPAFLSEGGFHRLQAERSVVIIDCGAPPDPKLDRFSHAGTLAFEMSVGRDRLIVNCGAMPAASDDWRDAGRATNAHSTLIIADTDSSELRTEGLGRRPSEVMASRQEAHGAHWLDASHDGWVRPFGAIHRRRLYLAASGEELLGEDTIEADSPQPYVIRFHLHPDVDANMQHDGLAVLLRLPQGGFWRLEAEGARMSLEESIYLAGPTPRKAEQVVLTGLMDGPQQVKWGIAKVG